jgi:hypothetical protein
MHTPVKAMIFSGDQRPDFSRRKGIRVPQLGARITQGAAIAMQFR